LWYRALVNRYGVSEGVISRGDSNSSIGWKDISSLDTGVGEDVSTFSVKEAYKKIISERESMAEPVLAKAWQKSIPTKVSCLVWQIFQNRVATKVNLYRRGVIDKRSIRCVGECGAEETTSHLFFECPVFAGIWSKISRWLGISTVFQNEGLSHLDLKDYWVEGEFSLVDSKQFRLRGFGAYGRHEMTRYSTTRKSM
jgi:hypothetical protein